MKNHSLGFALFVILAATGICADPVAMKEYSYKDTGIAFSMPQDPKVSTDIDKATGLATHMYLLDKGESALIISANVYKEFVLENKPDVFLKSGRDAMLQNMKGKVVSEKKITLAGHPGIEIVFEGDKLHGISRIYVVGRNLYQLLSATANGSPLMPGTDQIFDSFHLLKP